MTKTTKTGTPVKFTKKSANDKYPTVTLARLESVFSNTSSLNNGEFTLYIGPKSSNETFAVNFRQNRFGTGATCVALDWPKGLRKPSVGRAIEYVVKGIV
jgi:hypothetical protein